MTEENGANDALSTEDALKLIRKAEKGDREVLPALREWLDAYPVIWDDLADLAKTARDSLVKAMNSGKDLFAPEIYERKLNAMTKELAGLEHSPLERLLAERIVMCWLHLYYAETIYTQNMGELTLRQAEFHQQRITKAHNRYLSSIRTLAQVRRLGVPAIQVNVGEKQVNVAH